MNKLNFNKQLIYKLFLSFALLILSLVRANANDVYYEQCSSLSDIVDGQTYLLVISDGKKHYAVQSNSTNYTAVKMESDKTILNPANSIKWKATAGPSENTFYFQNGTNGLYNNGSDKKLSTITKDKSSWYISKLTTKNAFRISFDGKYRTKYICWSDSYGDTFAVFESTFYNQLESENGLTNRAGAFYIYKEVTGPTLSATVSTLDFVTTEAKPTDTKSFSLSGTKLTSSALLSITGDDAKLFSVSTSSIEPTDGSIPSTQITVSYNPASTSTPATHSAILNITSTDAAPIAIALKGRVEIDQTVYHNVSWMVNGSPYSAGTPTTTVADGSNVSQLPTAPANINEYKFVGWTTSQITTNLSTAPSVLFTSAAGAPEVKADVVYYAVYASQDGANQWKRLNASEVKEEGVYALVIKNGFAFTGVINNNGKSYYSSTQFSFNPSGIAASAPDDICELTLKKNGNGFSMYNAKYGYLYAKACSTGNLAWHKSESSYWYCMNDGWRYKANSAYLRSYDTVKSGYFNTYGNKANEDVYFAQKISSASYTTTIASVPSYTAKAISLKAEASKAYWATFSYSEPTFFPKAVAVNAITVADGRIIADADVFESSTDVAIGDGTLSGVYVPANTGVLIKSSENNITCYVVANKSVSAIDESRNMLKPAPTNGGVFTSAADKIYYKLAYDDYFTQKDLGFYYGADAGGAFYVKAETAYLAVPIAKTAGAKAFVLDGETTAINGISTRNNHAETVYNLNGQRVASMAKPGLYIVNGKKVVRK